MCSYSTGSNLFITSSALVHGSSLNFNLLSLVTTVPITANPADNNFILTVPLPLTCQLNNIISMAVNHHSFDIVVSSCEGYVW